MVAADCSLWTRVIVNAVCILASLSQLPLTFARTRSSMARSYLQLYPKPLGISSNVEMSFMPGATKLSTKVLPQQPGTVRLLIPTGIL